jgi:hypothetical protein
MLKWKLENHNNKQAEKGADMNTFDQQQFSFKIYSTTSKNFDSSYHILHELIENHLLKFNSNELNEIWTNLIHLCAMQAFAKRLKILNLLVMILKNLLTIEEMNSISIDLNALKPLKCLQYTLASVQRKNYHNLSRAMYELFLHAEKLSRKWATETEFAAHMRPREDFIEKVCQGAAFLKHIMNGFSFVNNKQQKKENLINKILEKNGHLFFKDKILNQNEIKAPKCVIDDEDDFADDDDGSTLSLNDHEDEPMDSDEDDEMIFKSKKIYNDQTIFL